MQIKLTAYGLDALQRGFEQAPAMARRELRVAMRDAVAHLESLMKGGMLGKKTEPWEFPVSSGNTRDSIAGDVFATPMGVLGVVASSQPVASFVDLGTRPHWVKMEPLLEWSARLGGSEKEIEQRAYIARAMIKRRGMEPRHVFEAALSHGWSYIERTFEDCAQRIAAKLAAGAA